MTKDRLIAFSDGVFAILITILVLEFTVPEFTSGHLLQAMGNQWPIFIAYLVSYFYVSTLWLFHHDYFSSLTSIDRNLNIINLVMLFSITLINYPMSLVAETISRGNLFDIRVALITYDVVALFISFMFFVIYKYIDRHRELKTDETTFKNFNKIKFDPLISVSFYALSIISTLFFIPLGVFFFLGGIIFHFIAYLRMSDTFGNY